MLRFLFFFGICMPFHFFGQVENYHLLNNTPEYHQVVRFYDSISKKHPYFRLLTYGNTDVGLPLQLFVISKSRTFNPAKLHQQNKVVMMINNGIHPGEPDGIDACINMVKGYALNPKSIPDSVVICIVPIFNIDGALQRNSVMRMNQNGPKEFGFRGNAKNLDLNRDFIKCDAENTRTLIKIFHEWKPELFVDTHVSNGADYPYTMTLIYPNAGKHTNNLRRILLPAIITEEVSNSMMKKGQEICPYVESVDQTPDSGLYEFNQTPRYITGFASLFNSVSFVTESHMLKPYPQRVKATIEILCSFKDCAEKYRNELIEWKKSNDKELMESQRLFYNWKHNKNIWSNFKFKGYEANFSASSFSGLPKLSYNRSVTWEKEIPFYNYFTPGDTVNVPEFYVIPQCWKTVVDILQLNGIRMDKFKNDTLIFVEADYITDFKTVSRPYEGHYLHSEIKTRKENQTIKFFRGDYFIPVRQEGIKFLIETLEPRSNDGFFAWNFFDAVLQQKEGFSDYAFEEDARRILNENPQIRLQLEETKKTDVSLAANHWQQLNFIFQHSKFKEKSHNRYPVFRITKVNPQ